MEYLSFMDENIFNASHGEKFLNFVKMGEKMQVIPSWKIVTKWDMRFFELAKTISEWSKDTSTKTGAVIVRDRQILSIGYNGFPRGMNDNISERYERPQKYDYTEHAERNAIYNALYNNMNIKGATIYSTFFPCVDCCRGLIQSGIVEVVTPNPVDASEKWAKSFAVSMEMFDEVGIRIKYI